MILPPEVLVIFGPTAAGKSALAHAAAVALGGEIIVADPFQRYRGLEIAADAPAAHHRAEVPYHLVGDLDLTHDSTAGTFAAAAHRVIDAIVARGGVPIVTGGTGLYLRAALTHMEMRSAPPPEVREWAQALAAHPSAGATELRARDPKAAEAIDLANPRRVARALERSAMGQSVDAGGDIWSAPPRRPALVVGITRPREVIDVLIAARVDREIGDGLVAELQRALQTPGLARAPQQVIGMREVAAMRVGALGRDGLPDALCMRTRRLARKQDTWLRRMAPDVLLDLADAPAVDTLPQLLSAWRRAREGVG